MLRTVSFPKNLILRINQNLNGNLHENFYFLTKLHKKWICGKCQIARRAWFW